MAEPRITATVGSPATLTIEGEVAKMTALFQARAVTAQMGVPNTVVVCADRDLTQPERATLKDWINDELAQGE